MNSEDYSITEENSSSRLERGQNNSGTSLHFERNPEGSIQVPIPCAVLTVCIITSLAITIVALSVGQYNCPGLYTSSVSSGGPVASCSDEWIEYQRKCYFFSTTRKSWDMAQDSCSKDGATLAVIDSKKDMVFLQRYAGGAKHWIGLINKVNQTWKWSNGEAFNNWFNLTGSEKCAFLNLTDVSSVDCEKNLHWICSKSSR